MHYRKKKGRGVSQQREISVIFQVTKLGNSVTCDIFVAKIVVLELLHAYSVPDIICHTIKQANIF